LVQYGRKGSYRDDIPIIFFPSTDEEPPPPHPLPSPSSSTDEHKFTDNEEPGAPEYKHADPQILVRHPPPPPPTAAEYEATLRRLCDDIERDTDTAVIEATTKQNTIRQLQKNKTSYIW
jgi:hypothetical protein